MFDDKQPCSLCGCLQVVMDWEHLQIGDNIVSVALFILNPHHHHLPSSQNVFIYAAFCRWMSHCAACLTHYCFVFTFFAESFCTRWQSDLRRRAYNHDLWHRKRFEGQWGSSIQLVDGIMRKIKPSSAHLNSSELVYCPLWLVKSVFSWNHVLKSLLVALFNEVPLQAVITSDFYSV